MICLKAGQNKKINSLRLAAVATRYVRGLANGSKKLNDSLLFWAAVERMLYFFVYWFLVHCMYIVAVSTGSRKRTNEHQFLSRLL